MDKGITEFLVDLCKIESGIVLGVEEQYNSPPDGVFFISWGMGGRILLQLKSQIKFDNLLMEKVLLVLIIGNTLFINGERQSINGEKFFLEAFDVEDGLMSIKIAAE